MGQGLRSLTNGSRGKEGLQSPRLVDCKAEAWSILVGEARSLSPGRNGSRLQGVGAEGGSSIKKKIRDAAT